MTLRRLEVNTNRDHGILALGTSLPILRYNAVRLHVSLLHATLAILPTREADVVVEVKWSLRAPVAAEASAAAKRVALARVLLVEIFPWEA